MLRCHREQFAKEIGVTKDEIIRIAKECIAGDDTPTVEYPYYKDMDLLCFGRRLLAANREAAGAEATRIEASLHITQDLLTAAERRWQRDVEICRNLGADAAAEQILSELALPYRARL